MSETTDEVVKRSIGAAIKLVGNKKLQDDLQDEEHFQESLQALEMPNSARASLLSLLARMEFHQDRAVNQGVQADEGKTPNELVISQNDRYENMQLEAFGNIRMSYRVALGMSIVLFLIGLCLTGIAVFEAVRENSISTSTLTIAGLGLADFVLLFFRQPWQDASINLTNSQHNRILWTSYLVGLALLQRGDTKSLELLDKLTERSIVMLQQNTEERDAGKDPSKATQA